MPSANITTSGGLISDDFVERLREPGFNHPAVGAGSFGSDDGKKHSLEADIALAYELLRARYEPLREQLPKLDIPELRKRWLLPILRDLGFEPVFKQAALTIDAAGETLSFSFSHRGWEGDDAPILHSTPWGQAFDQKPAQPRRAKSPHDSLQSYLNLSNQHLWAVLTDGGCFRLLRDFHQTLTKGYVEIDLVGILESGDLGDFRAFYRLLHPSRFKPFSDGKCPLELFKDDSQQTGIEVGKRLRQQVHAAIECLGNAFLKTDPALLQRLKDDDKQSHAYYEQILHLVYRLLFLFFVEQRGWIPKGLSAYWDSYSVSGLRDRSLDPYAAQDDHLDLWEGLKATFRIVRDGLKTENGELTAYGGQLFNDKQMAILLAQSCKNADLLIAIRLLSFFEHKKVAQRINYARLEIEALGSVYESLLDYAPRVLATDETVDEKPRRAGEFVLDPRSLARKTSGSHYTPKPLVNELIESALRPVIRDRLAEAKGKEEAALLRIRVCDPACGSGAFLLAAMDTLGMELARIRIGEESDPTDEQLRQARRDVLQHSIYGVDLNPMAVELCKVTLWIHAAMPKLPLTFLDHRIRCGNSLVGVPTPAMVDKFRGHYRQQREDSLRELREKSEEYQARDIDRSISESQQDDRKVFESEIRFMARRAKPEYVGWPDAIPATAFEPIDGDHVETAREILKRHKKELSGKPDQLALSYLMKTQSAIERFKEFEGLHQDNVQEVEHKAELWRRWHEQTERSSEYRLANLWCSAFFWRAREGVLLAPTQGVFTAVKNGEKLDDRIGREVAWLASKYRFFHWHLEFPDIFSSGRQGFDVMLGNPPWDTLSPDAKEFFSQFDPSVRFQDAGGQAAIIKRLTQSPAIAEMWEDHCRSLFSLVRFLKQSGRFVLYAEGNLGKGDFNIYRMFVELALKTTQPGGAAAQLVPEGIYNGANCAAIREALLEESEWQLLLGFENAREIWFKDVHTAMKFALYVARVGSRTEALRVRFNIRTLDGLAEASRGGTIRVPVAMIREFSPDALAIMEFGDQRDIDIAIKMYDRWPKFGDEGAGPPIRTYMAELHMGNDRELFTEEATALPVYEGRMVDQFDHRAKGYRGGRGRAAEWADLEFGQPGKSVQPQWRITPENVPDKVRPRLPRYRLVFCDVTSPTNERSLVAALVPPETVCGHKVPTVTFEEGQEWAGLLWLCVANSFAMDFLARKKIALSMSYTVLDSLPFPRLTEDDPIARLLVPLALRLTCCGSEMTACWNARAAEGWCAPVDPKGPPPGEEDPEQRFQLRAQIDAIVARDLFGLTADEMSYILETFPIVKRKDVHKHKEYRTKRVILEIYDEMAAAAKYGKPDQTRLDPPPGDPRAAHPKGVK